MFKIGIVRLPGMRKASLLMQRSASWHRNTDFAFLGECLCAGGQSICSSAWWWHNRYCSWQRQHRWWKSTNLLFRITDCMTVHTSSMSSSTPSSMLLLSVSLVKVQNAKKFLVFHWLRVLVVIENLYDTVQRSDHVCQNEFWNLHPIETMEKRYTTENA